MLRHLSIFGFALLLLMPALTAQQRAPQNDSITQADLRADLFFLAGDSLRGRLTDTEENRATADYIRSRFERMGLKPAGPNGSFFQTVQPDDRHARRGQPARCDRRRRRDAPSRVGQEFYPQRISASGQASAPLMFVGFGISAPHLQHDDYGGDVKGKIVLALDHEPGERDPNSPFDGVVTSESSTLWRKGGRGPGEGRGRNPVRQRRAQSSRRGRTSRQPRGTSGPRSRRGSRTTR